MLGQDPAVDLDVLQSTDFLVDQGIEAAYKTDLGKRLKEVGAGVASGAAIGASIGTAFPVIGNIVGGIIGSVVGAIAGIVPWLLGFLNPCEFMVRGEGDVSCGEFPGRVEAAAKWVQANPARAVNMTPVELANQFGIFLNRAEAEVGMGGDATPLMALPEAEELLRLVQVPAAAAVMTTVPESKFQSELQALSQIMPALKLNDLRAISERVVPASPSGFTARTVTAVRTATDEASSSGWGAGMALAVGAVTTLGVAAAYAFATKQPVRAIPQKVYGSARRLWTRG